MRISLDWFQLRCKQAYRARKGAMADVRESVAMYYNSTYQHTTVGYKTPTGYVKVLNKVS